MQSYGRVIAIRRNIDDICRDLEAAASSTPADGGHRPTYPGGASVIDTWSRRRPIYTACSTLEFAIRAGDDDWTAITADFTAMLTRVLRLRAVPTPPLLPAHFVCLTVPDVASMTVRSGDGSALAWARAVTEGADAVELRADLLATLDEEFVLSQLAVLRRANPDVAVVFTLRSDGEGGGTVAVLLSASCV